MTVSGTFYRGETLTASDLNTALAEHIVRTGDTMQGLLRLAQDPVNAFDAATKQYVDRFTAMGVPTGAYIGATPPGNTLAPLWWDTVSGQLYIQYNDGSSTQWVAANSGGGGSTASNTSIINVLDNGAKGDGITDDTNAINDVIHAYAGKATVFIPVSPTGQPYMCSPLTLPSGADILIMGTLKLLPGSSIGLIVVNTGKTGITLRGNGVLDGNASAITVASTATVSLNQSNNIRISGLTIQNAKAWNLNVTACTDVVIDSVTMLGGYNANEFAHNCDNCWLTNCTIDGASNDPCFTFYGGVTNSGALGNVLRNAGVAGSIVTNGINVLGDEHQPTACSNIIIGNNIIYDCYGGGISVIQGVGGIGNHSNIVISNNRCYDNGTPGFRIADIGIHNCVDALVIGNLSSGLVGSPAFGFYVGDGSTSVNVVGNLATKVGAGTTTGVGLYIEGANIVLASGNEFIDNQTTPSMQFAIDGGAGLRSAFVGNLCDKPIDLTLQADTVMANSVGGRWTINNQSYSTLPPNAANDAAAASGGVPVGGVYRNGSVMMVRTV